ncbi:hypothetical protein [Amaricoccus sp.]|uniref:hypothetical protein n=1 Tax=Amaricoccus sp. TaxID=1872485 RepID=UPI001B6C054A|nr:hypothetical protein [Amaricoccus sp.]MBP7240482.1 hypothetical protein [Amaricoccus sp.]
MRFLSVVALCLGALSAAAEAATLASFSSLSTSDPNLPRLTGFDSANGDTRLFADGRYANAAAASGAGRTLASDSSGDLARGVIGMSGSASGMGGDTYAPTASYFRLDATFTTDRLARLTYSIAYSGAWSRRERNNGAMSVDINLASGADDWQFGDAHILTGLPEDAFDDRLRVSHMVRPGVTYNFQLLIDAAMTGGIGYESGAFALNALVGLGATNGARITFDDERLFSDAVAPVPLPLPAALLGAGMLGLGAVGRRRRVAR